MKRKIYLLLIFMVILEQNLKATVNRVETIRDEVEIDLNSNRIISTDGVNFQYENIKLKAFELKSDKSKNEIYMPGKFFLEVDEPTGKLKLDSENGSFNKETKTGSFGKSFGYLEVGQVTGAEKPNDRIYFGGDTTKYIDGKVYLKNAWFTTDPKIVEDNNPLNVGYHLKSKTIVVEPDKQITFKNSDLYIQGKDVMPFTLPWYRINIRQGSKVPLFPSWGNDSKDGWYITSGILWGDSDSKYRGGIAPKFGDLSGISIGRMENWYDAGQYGKGQLNINDWLVYKKANKDDVDRNFNQWDFNYKHNYSGEYGYLNANYQNATYNMIPTLDDAIDKYFYGRNQNNSSGWKYVDGVPDKGGSLGFYTLNTDLVNLGSEGDISLKANINLVSDKEVYGVLVADQVNDMGYGSTSDFRLMSDLSIKKENDRYSMGAYYNYLHDMDPGSTKTDLKSKAENFGFNYSDNEYKMSISYDDKTEDKYRRLNSWERDPNFSKKMNETYFGIPLNYTPWTISQYDIYDSRKLKTVLGEYELYNNFKYKVGYDYSYIENKLSLTDDPFRKIALLDGSLGKTNNLRDVQYNRYENIIYNKTSENRAYVDFIYNSIKLTVAGGDTKEEIWDRTGIYSKEAWDRDSYKIYINNSNFYEIGILDDKISLYNFGEIQAYGNLRFDQYNDGYSQRRDEEISTNDKSTRVRAGVTHNVILFDNSENRDRKTDFTLSNKVTYMNQNYSYNSDNDISKEERMFEKENVSEVSDTVTFELGNTTTIYSIDYKETKRASNDNRIGEILNQKIEFLVDQENSLSFNYDIDKRFTNENLFEKNTNDLTFKDFGVKYRYSNNNFYYKNKTITSDIWEIEDVNNANEKIKENIYGYSYNFGNNKLNLEYIDGKDKRNESSLEVINTKNKTYSASYSVGGEVEHFYRASYEEYKNKGDWNPNLSNYNSDVIYLAYSYKDKRFTDQELVSYAASEYKKSPNQLTQVEIDRVRQVLQDRENSRTRSFNLDRVIDDRSYFGDYKRGLYTSVMMQRNNKRYEQTGNYLKSLEEFEGRLFYSYNRIGLGYIYNQKSGYGNYEKLNWRDTEKEHEVSLNAKIGKPSEGWRTKLYVKFYDQLHGRDDKAARSTFDGFGVELGKEFGYYEWAVAYERDYSYRTKDYEWRVAVQFKLLTFPENNIFGIGAGGSKDNKTSPDTYLFDGIKIDDLKK